MDFGCRSDGGAERNEPKGAPLAKPLVNSPANNVSEDYTARSAVLRFALLAARLSAVFFCLAGKKIRRVEDSNLRSLARLTLSRRALSTAQPTLQIINGFPAKLFNSRRDPACEPRERGGTRPPHSTTLATLQIFV